VLTAIRLEDYSISAADALLCPSRYLARQAETHYGLAEGTIKLVAYPMGESRKLERDTSTWESGTICYVGRLELRKGVMEWVEAALAIAREYPESRFEFVGDDTIDARGTSVRALLERRIPGELKRMFSFRGRQMRSSLPKFLAQARVAVVPSRWENFPNSCIEAMGSGLPVIATREGGMAEMIEDGRTGWLSARPCSEGLRVALARALETPAERIAEMGRDAASDIRQLCDNKRIVEKHLDLRDEIVCRGTTRSIRLPVNLPWAKRSLCDESARRTPQNSSAKGLAIVITCLNSGRFLDKCLRSIEQQTHKPAYVIVVDDGSTEKRTLEALSWARREGWQVIYKRNEGPASAKNAGIDAVTASGLSPLGFAFLSLKDRLHSGFTAACESLLEQCPEVGIVSCWARHSSNDHSVWIRPCPGFPYQWLSNEAAPFSAVRTEALLEAGKFRPVINHGYDYWDLFNAVMAAGWATVTVPEILVDHQFGEETGLHITNVKGYRKARREILERFPDLVARDAKEIILLIELAAARSLSEQVTPSREHLARALSLMRHPLGPASQVLERLKCKILRHAPGRMSGPIS
jgi:GT2 family glycosyltransferase